MTHHDTDIPNVDLRGPGNIENDFGRAICVRLNRVSIRVLSVTRLSKIAKDRASWTVAPFQIPGFENEIISDCLTRAWLVNLALFESFQDALVFYPQVYIPCLQICALV